MTRLDELAQAMQSGSQETALRFYQALADSDLVLLMDGEDTMRPKVFELSDGPMILAYDMEERLSEMHGVASYAALPGRVLAQQIVGKRLSLGLNLGSDAASEMVLPPDALSWLCDMLDRQIQVDETAVLDFASSGLSDGFIASLKFAMAGAGALISSLGVVAATTHSWTGEVALQEIVVIFGAPTPAEEPLARAVSEAASFAAMPADSVAVQFLPDLSFAPKAMAAVMRLIQLPAPPIEDAKDPAAAPGMDPDRPPRLR